MSFTSDTRYYQHLGPARDLRGLTEIAPGLDLGGATNELEVLASNAHRAWTQGQRARWCAFGAWGAEATQAAFFETASTSFVEAARVPVARADEREGYTLYLDKEDAEVRVTLLNLATGATVGAAVATTDGAGRFTTTTLGHSSVTTSPATALYLLVEVKAVTGTGKLYGGFALEDNTST